MKTNHWYYWITGALFVVLGLLMVVLDATLPIIPVQLAIAMDNHFGWVILAWGAFRGLNGYWIYQRKLQSSDDE